MDHSDEHFDPKRKKKSKKSKIGCPKNFRPPTYDPKYPKYPHFDFSETCSKNMFNLVV